MPEDVLVAVPGGGTTRTCDQAGTLTVANKRELAMLTPTALLRSTTATHS
jgi:hypothetical protein